MVNTKKESLMLLNILFPYQQTAGEMAGYPGPGDISAAYGGLWESHHCLTGQSPGLAAHYPDILAGFTPDLGEIIINVFLVF